MSTYYKKGCWSALCDVCGFKFKSDELKARWDGQIVCRADFELRNPQDFIQIPKDDSSVPWARPVPNNSYIGPTFSAQYRGIGTTLSNNNLTVSTMTGISVLATGAIPPESGKVYWEVTLGTSSSSVMIGVAPLNVDLYMQAPVPALVYYSADGYIYLDNSTQSSTNPTSSSGDVIGLLFDSTLNILTFYKNGVVMVDQGIGISGTVYPIVGGNIDAFTDSATINFGPTFAYSLPTGARTL